MGPWVHGGWSRGDGRTLGDVSFNAKTAEFYREQIELPFFEYHLKGKGKLQAPRGVDVRDRHERLAQVRRLAAAERQAAVALLPRRRQAARRHAARDAAANGHDEYVSDPGQAGAVLSDKIAIGMAPEYMTADQRFAVRRPDVLVYQTDVLDDGRDDRRADRGRAVRLDDRHRLRLGREGDRRLSGRLSRSRTRTRRA